MRHHLQFNAVGRDELRCPVEIAQCHLRMVIAVVRDAPAAVWYGV
ncbi:hypothetical protein [Victivallis vadensis]|nr:hypothetical protein [Victivallis vadensis]